MENNTQAVATATKPKSGLRSFNEFVASPRTQEHLAQVLGEKKGSFVNNLTALVANNRMLQECEPMGLMYTAIKATALNLPLDPNLGLAYVLPYRNNKLGITEAQFQIGYKGFVQLAIRSGQFAKIAVRDVREGEIVNYDGTDYISLMPTNLYGPNDNYHPTHSHVLPALIRRFHEAKVEGRETVTCWGDGSPRREFLYVDDLADL